MKRLGLVEELRALKREGQQHHRRTRLGVLADVTGGSGVTPINTATNRPGKAIKVGGRASLIAITPNGTTAYLVVGNSLVPINTANNQVGRAIKAGTQPIAIAFTP
jgi:DNA-binding beta-propeller fold protein YncE